MPDRLLGRVMAIYSLCWNLLPLGGLLAGVLAAAANARVLGVTSQLDGQKGRAVL